MRPILLAVPPLREGLITSGIVVGAAIVAWAVISHVARRTVERVVERSDQDGTVAAAERAMRLRTLWSLFRMFILIALVASIVLVLMGIWGVPIAPLLAVMSVVGVAIGFGAQDFVKDVISGVLIIAEGQYSLGDIVRIAGVSGSVESIKIRTTVLRDLDGNVHHVPNGQIEVTTNYTQEYSQVVVDLGVAYDTDLDLALDIVQDEVERFAADPEWSDVFLDPPELLGVEELGESSIRLRLVYKVKPMARWASRREFLRRIKLRFDQEGIVIPFPHLTLVRPTETPRRSSAAEGRPPIGGRHEPTEG